MTSMERRRALLIGISEYEGPRRESGADHQVKLWDLPAARNDLKQMSGALKECGYEITIVPEDETFDTKSLGNQISRFIASAEPGETLVIYFSGHGLAVNGNACMVPGRTEALDASQDGYFLPTDYSAKVSASVAGVVLFIVDACRNASGVSWGSSNRREKEPRFIRYFSADTTSPTAYADNQGRPISVFTRALAQCLRKPDVVNLAQLHRKVLDELRPDDYDERLDPIWQQPSLDQGELGKDSHLELNIFSLKDAQSISSTAWPYNRGSFDPSAFQCVVISSEHESRRAPIATLEDVVNTAARGAAGRPLWSAFRHLWSQRVPLTGSGRDIGHYDVDKIHVRELAVHDIFADEQNLQAAIRGVVEADLAVFDLTGWEPGIMMLIGVRSATRRGVTIGSLGGGWKEGEPIKDLPFGLKDLSVHATGEYKKVGYDAPERMAKRATAGFQQMARQPSYLDLPAYDALRQLGFDYDSAGSIGVDNRFVVFCPYDDGLDDNEDTGWPGYERNWRQVHGALDAALNTENVNVNIARLIDVGTPQMISKAMFEYLRRAEACLFDWTEYNGSVFLELGVRLATSPWGAIQIIDERWRPNEQFAPRAKSEPGDEEPLSLRQLEGMVRIFNPIPYRVDNRDVTEKALRQAVNKIVKNGRTIAIDGPDNPIYELVIECLSTVTAQRRPVHVELMNEADAVHHSEQERRGRPRCCSAATI